MPEIVTSHSYSVVRFTGQRLLVVGPRLKRIVGDIDHHESLLVIRDASVMKNHKLEDGDLVLMHDPRHKRLLKSKLSSYIIPPFHASKSSKVLMDRWRKRNPERPVTAKELAKLWVIPLMMGPWIPSGTLLPTGFRTEERTQTLILPRKRSTPSLPTWKQFQLEKIRIHRGEESGTMGDATVVEYKADQLKNIKSSLNSGGVAATPESA